jgi:hypothetical protein
MENKKHKHPDPNDQVHSEFENSDGSHFDVVREETLAKQRGETRDGPLNQLPDEESVKNEQSAGEEPPKMDAPGKT